MILEATGLGRQPMVLLAAGSSSRMGRSKPLLSWRGSTFLSHACAAARAGGAGPVLVVAENPKQFVDRAGELGEVIWVECPQAQRGQSESLRRGLAAAVREVPRAGAILIGLVDQVGLRPESVRLVLDSIRDDDRDAWVADYGGEGRVPGHPVALGPATWPLVQALRGDTGARGILSALGERVRWVPMPAEWRPIDCDTPEDYRRLLALDRGRP